MSDTTNQSATGTWRADGVSAIHVVFGLSVLLCLVMAMVSLGL